MHCGRAGLAGLLRLSKGAIGFYLRAIGQLNPCNLRFVLNGLHTHHIAKERHHLFKLLGPQS